METPRRLEVFENVCRKFEGLAIYPLYQDLMQPNQDELDSPAPHEFDRPENSKNHPAAFQSGLGLITMGEIGVDQKFSMVQHEYGGQRNNTEYDAPGNSASHKIEEEEEKDEEEEEEEEVYCYFSETASTKLCIRTLPILK